MDRALRSIANLVDRASASRRAIRIDEASRLLFARREAEAAIPQNGTLPACVGGGPARIRADADHERGAGPVGPFLGIISITSAQTGETRTFRTRPSADAGGHGHPRRRRRGRCDRLAPGAPRRLRRRSRPGPAAISRLARAWPVWGSAASSTACARRAISASATSPTLPAGRDLRPAGADFIGLNPMHALLPPSRALQSLFAVGPAILNSPISRSTRSTAAGCAGAARARSHGSASHARHHRLSAGRRPEARPPPRPVSVGPQDEADFRHWRDAAGPVLLQFALFEALSEWLVSQGHSAGWYGWPETIRIPPAPPSPASPRTMPTPSPSIAGCNGWPMSSSAAAQRRARAAGMRIGLYLDLAVGVCARWSATWSDRALVVPGAGSARRRTY